MKKQLFVAFLVSLFWSPAVFGQDNPPSNPAASIASAIDETMVGLNPKTTILNFSLKSFGFNLGGAYDAYKANVVKALVAKGYKEGDAIQMVGSQFKADMDIAFGTLFNKNLAALNNERDARVATGLVKLCNLSQDRVNWRAQFYCAEGSVGTKPEEPSFYEDNKAWIWVGIVVAALAAGAAITYGALEASRDSNQRVDVYGGMGSASRGLQGGVGIRF